MLSGRRRGARVQGAARGATSRAGSRPEATERGMQLAPGGGEGARRACRRLRPGGRRRARQQTGAIAVDGARQARPLPPVDADRARTTSGRSSPRWSRARSGRSPTRSASAGSPWPPPLLERLLETTPEPVLLAVRSTAGSASSSSRRPARAPATRGPAASARRWAITASSGPRSCADQARRWTAPELDAALDGLLELDAMVKGAPGAELDRARSGGWRSACG